MKSLHECCKDSLEIGPRNVSEGALLRLKMMFYCGAYAATCFPDKDQVRQEVEGWISQQYDKDLE